MAGYKGGADQTVIQAAKSAVAIPKGYHASIWDYKDELATFVNGVANVAKFVVGKVDAANERAVSYTHLRAHETRHDRCSKRKSLWNYWV